MAAQTPHTGPACSIYPDIDAAVVALSNHGNFPGSIAVATAEAFFAEYFDPADDSSVGDVPSAAAVDARALARFMGVYELETGTAIEFELEGNEVRIIPTSGDPLPVEILSSMSVRVPGGVIVKFNNVDGHLGLTLPNGVEGDRLQPWQPTVGELAAFEGRYFSDELQTTYVFEVKDQRLVFNHARLDEVELQAKKKDTFSGAFPLLEAAFERNDEGKATGLTVSSGRTKNIRFSRVP